MKNRYMIEKHNWMDYQQGPMCSGYAAAYVLRYLGIEEAEGKAVYAKFKHKLSNGYVLPGEIIKIFKQYGFSAHLIHKDVEGLKKELLKGNYMIAISITDVERKWLHYVTITGFDDEYIYIADSLEELKNCEGKGYNRRVDYVTFQKLMDTRRWCLPFVQNYYICVEANKDI